MAAVLLIPGRGGRYTSETFTANSVTGADTIDISRCNGLIIQSQSIFPVGGTYIIEESEDNVNWVTLQSAISATNKQIKIVSSSLTQNAYNLIRLNINGVTNLTSTETLIVTIMGGAIGSGLF